MCTLCRFKYKDVYGQRIVRTVEGIRHGVSEGTCCSDTWLDWEESQNFSQDCQSPEFKSESVAFHINSTDTHWIASPSIGRHWFHACLYEMLTVCWRLKCVCSLLCAVAGSPIQMVEEIPMNIASSPPFTLFLASYHSPIEVTTASLGTFSSLMCVWFYMAITSFYVGTW
jgi:hypothetical protein